MTGARSWAAWLGIFLLLAGAAPGTAQQTRPLTENERYVSFFDYIVFGSEFRGRASTTVRKWTEVPI
ncbi:MAG: hypothetical protein FJ029_08775, partial [Actinobacteria bacterium]|nr:hypothetical protein [Actinomycetota bacterium]